MCMCVRQGREFLKANIVQFFFAQQLLMIWISENHLGKKPRVLAACGQRMWKSK